MTNDQKKALLRAGIGQVDRDGLRRLAHHIEAGRPLLLTGEVFSSGVG